MKIESLAPARLLGKVRRVHFVGIGGAGMSGIAALLQRSGYRVSGSDMKKSVVTEKLKRLGTQVRIGHNARHVRGADVVVVSAAVPRDNPEIQEAKRLGIPVIPRTEMLAELMRLKYGIAVSGTHGKTTTTSMIGLLLKEAGWNPTVVVGGQVDALEAKTGRTGPYLVAEACEAFREFFLLSPILIVITNVDDDHLDTYGSLREIQEAFLQFARKVPFYGCVVANGDDPNLAPLFKQLERRIVTFGFSRHCDFRVAGYRPERTFGSCFQVFRKEKKLGEIRLNVPGRHNAQNALAACAVGLELGIPFTRIAKALGKFEGARRRFEIKGKFHGALVIEDYAHHPTEIQACLAAAREAAGKEKKIFCVFQPHLYSRTKFLKDKFARAFSDADAVYVLDVYGAREKPIAGVNSESLVEAMQKAGHPEAHYARDVRGLKQELREKVNSKTWLLFLGAGDIGHLAQEWAAPAG